MPNIAISYRDPTAPRSPDASSIAWPTHYGKHAVFMDVDAIPIVVDFRAHIDNLAHTDVLLAVIGAQWLGARRGRSADP